MKITIQNIAKQILIGGIAKNICTKKNNSQEISQKELQEIIDWKYSQISFDIKKNQTESLMTYFYTCISIAQEENVVPTLSMPKIIWHPSMQVIC